MTRATITLTIEQDGEIKTEQGMEIDDGKKENWEGAQLQEVPQEMADRYAVASDLANFCEFLTDAEVIKIRLIVSKAQERERRGESDG